MPLVGGGEAEGWVDLRRGMGVAERKASEAERREARMGKVDDAVVEKLKNEIVQPYQQNWIGIVVVAIAILAVAFKFTGGFESIPIIPVPDL